MSETATPKRRNPVKTRARILETAFALFAKQGYPRTGIRQIAEQAGVASSLVVRYYGTKASLFEEALINAIYAHGYFVRNKADFGERMAELVVNDRDARLPAAMVLALADKESKAIAEKVTQRIVIASIAEWLGPPHAEVRALNMLALLNGFVIQTRHLRAGTVPPESTRWLANALQAIVDEGENLEPAKIANTQDA